MLAVHVRHGIGEDGEVIGVCIVLCASQVLEGSGRVGHTVDLHVPGVQVGLQEGSVRGIAVNIQHTHATELG